MLALQVQEAPGVKVSRALAQVGVVQGTALVVAAVMELLT
jgi:hypothetical protein